MGHHRRELKDIEVSGIANEKDKPSKTIARRKTPPGAPVKFL
jgi:hypothetical protein